MQLHLFIQNEIAASASDKLDVKFEHSKTLRKSALFKLLTDQLLAMCEEVVGHRKKGKGLQIQKRERD